MATLQTEIMAAIIKSYRYGSTAPLNGLLLYTPAVCSVLQLLHCRLIAAADALAMVDIEKTKCCCHDAHVYGLHHTLHSHQLKAATCDLKNAKF